MLIVTVAGCGGGEEKILPKISQEAIQMATDQIMQAEYVKDAAAGVKDKTISMVVIVSPLVSHRAKDIGDNFVRLLGTFTAVFDDDLESPTKDSYGSIYDYYDVLISVRTGAGEDNIVEMGAKASIASSIRW